jgi:RNA polymerase sigma factor (sigma-70 family)
MSYNNELKYSMKTNSTKLTSEENKSLYARIKQGDENARQQMITGYMPLVVDVVDTFLKSRPHLEYLRDDLMSEGFLNLTSSVTKFVVRDVDEPTAYLASTLRRAIAEVVCEIGDKPGCAERYTFGPDSTEEIDILDELDAACLTDLDRKLVELRRAGFTFYEIAEAVERSRPTVRNDFNAIRERFEQKEKLLST